MPRQATDHLPTHHLRFLVVDDYDDIRDVFCSFIQRAGHLASAAADGVAAVEMVQRESFDVMLLDLTMPRMDGAAVVRWLNEHPGVAPGMRVVVVTAWATKNEQLLQELGVETVLNKPPVKQDFENLITQAMLDRESAGTAP